MSSCLATALEAAPVQILEETSRGADQVPAVDPSPSEIETSRQKEVVLMPA